MTNGMSAVERKAHRPITTSSSPYHRPGRGLLPIRAAVGISALGALLLGTVLPLTQVFTTGAHTAARLDDDRAGDVTAHPTGPQAAAH